MCSETAETIDLGICLTTFLCHCCCAIYRSNIIVSTVGCGWLRFEQSPRTITEVDNSKLKMNTRKTQLLLLSRKRREREMSRVRVTMNKEVMERSKSVKCLCQRAKVNTRNTRGGLKFVLSRPTTASVSGEHRIGMLYSISIYPETAPEASTWLCTNKYLRTSWDLRTLRQPQRHQHGYV